MKEAILVVDQKSVNNWNISYQVPSLQLWCSDYTLGTLAYSKLVKTETWGKEFWPPGRHPLMSIQAYCVLFWHQIAQHCNNARWKHSIPTSEIIDVTCKIILVQIIKVCRGRMLKEFFPSSCYKQDIRTTFFWADFKLLWSFSV